MSDKSLASLRCLDLIRPRSSTFLRADPFAIIEASLTSVKYSLYQVVGGSVLHYICPYNFSTPSLLTSTASGLIGGTLFTIPFLISLGRGNNATYTSFTYTFSCQLSLFGAELFYSMIGGGVGMLALGDWSHIGIIMGMVRGFIGPLMVFAVLYLLLRITLAFILFTY